MRMLIMGPPGAGKGTQATAIAERYRVPAISTGDMFRAHIAAGTDLGREINRIIAAGEYVDDSITNRIVELRLNERDALDGFLLDGYPRTLAQVETLDGLLRREREKLDCVLLLTADQDDLVERLLERAKIQGRADDNEETIRRRQEVYARETAPLIRVYKKRGILLGVDGLGTIDEVRDRLFAALDERFPAPVGP